MKPCQTSKNTEVWYDPPLSLPKPSTLSMNTDAIRNRMVFDSRFDGHSCYTMLDTGANSSHMDYETFKKLSIPLNKATDQGITIAGETTFPYLGQQCQQSGLEDI
jgi:hypothetical protein